MLRYTEGLRPNQDVPTAARLALIIAWLVATSVSPSAQASPSSDTAPQAKVPVTLFVEASDKLPGFDRADVPRYLCERMAASRLAGWQFEPASPGLATPPNRVEWEFRLHLRAAGGVGQLHREKRLFGTRRLATIKVKLFLNGKYQGASCGEARIRGGPDDRDLAAAILKLTQSVLGGSARSPCPASRVTRPAEPRFGYPKPSAFGRREQSTASRDPGEPHGFRKRDVATGEWGGLRSQLEEQGVSIGIDWVLEGFNNFRGGIKTGPVAASTFDVDLSLDMEKLLGISNAEFYADLEDHAGRDPSAGRVGDLQVFDKFNYTPYFQVFELWYQQRLFKDTLRIKVGKVDANTEFSVIDNGLSFRNSSTQVTPTLFVFPTTPDPMPSVNLFYTPKEFFYADFAVYDANRSDRFLDFSGSPAAIQPARHGQLFIGETGLYWNLFPMLKADGNLRLGFWGHNGTFARFDGGSQHGAEGLYVIFDQTLWKPTPEQNETRGLRMFLEYGHTDPAVNTIYQHFGGGLAWTGPLPVRRQDVLGFSPQYAHISREAGLPHNYELALETFYKVQFTPWASFQPDFQYIAHPGGQYPAALVGTLAIEVIF
jgi:porin